MKPPRAAVLFVAGVACALAAGWVGFPRVLYRRQAQPFQFSHQAHTGESLGLECEACHALEADGRFAGIPTLAKCRECHEQAVGEAADERVLVDEYVTPGREIPWLVYSRQPDNVRFSHALHVRRGGVKCEECHGPHGASASLPPHERNRLSGYSRTIWGPSPARLSLEPWQGKKMTDCSGCHVDRGVAESCLGCHK